MAGHRPLPEHPLTEEAVRRRQERIAANVLRESKSHKKVAAPVAPRKVAPLDSNSVAARRLAAKRGGTTPGADLVGSFSPAERSHAHPAAGGDFAVDFDAFGDSAPPAAVPPAAAAHSDFTADFGAHDDFAPTTKHSSRPSSVQLRDDHPVIVAAAGNQQLSSAASLFEDYDDSDAAPAAPFAAAPAFTATSSSSTHSSTFDAFAPSTASLVDFDEAPVDNAFRSSFADSSLFDAPHTGIFISFM